MKGGDRAKPNPIATLAVDQFKRKKSESDGLQFGSAF